MTAKTHHAEHDLMAAFGFDSEDPQVTASLEDAEAHSRLLQTLVSHRECQKLTQREVAQRMGTTQSRVSTLERLGGNPTLWTLFRYARAVNAKLKPMVVPCASTWTSTSTVLVAVPAAANDDDVVFAGNWAKVDRVMPA